MADIGPTLREARMRDGRDISEIEALTKIRAKYLRALENEEWALLPGPTFTKGFLRSYSDVLGLDSRLLVDEYRRQWEEPHELDVPVRPTIGAEGREVGRRLSARVRRSRWLAALALIVVLAIVVVLIGSPSNSPAPSSPGSGSTPGSHTPSGGAGPSAKTVSLRIEPTAPVYVCLVGDGGVVRLHKVIDVHTAVTTFLARRFVLSLSNTSPKLVIDGRLATVPHGGAFARYAITASGRTRLSLPARHRCP
jgi:hypothetical protein